MSFLSFLTTVLNLQEIHKIYFYTLNDIYNNIDIFWGRDILHPRVISKSCSTRIIEQRSLNCNRSLWIIFYSYYHSYSKLLLIFFFEYQISISNPQYKNYIQYIYKTAYIYIKSVTYMGREWDSSGVLVAIPLILSGIDVKNYYWCQCGT